MGYGIKLILIFYKCNIGNSISGIFKECHHDVVCGETKLIFFRCEPFQPIFLQ